MDNCSHVDGAMAGLRAMDNDVFVWPASIAFVVAGALLIVVGRRIVRIASACGAGAAAVLVAWEATTSVDACATRIWIAVAAAAVAFVVVLCMFRIALFVLGAIGFGTVAYSVYGLLPLDGVEQPFRLLDVPGYQLVSTGVAALLGGLLTVVKRSVTLPIVSSIAGASLVVVGAAWIVRHTSGAQLPEWAFLVAIGAGAPCGWYVQRRPKPPARPVDAPDGVLQAR